MRRPRSPARRCARNEACRPGRPVLALILGGAAPGVAQQAPIVRGAGPLPAGASALRLEGTPIQGALVRGHARPGTRLTLDGHDVPVAADGTFVLGFDRDAPAATLVVERPGPAGTPLVVTTTLTVAPRRGGSSGSIPFRAFRRPIR